MSGVNRAVIGRKPPIYNHAKDTGKIIYNKCTEDKCVVIFDDNGMLINDRDTSIYFADKDGNGKYDTRATSIHGSDKPSVVQLPEEQYDVKLVQQKFKSDIEK